MTLRVNRIYCIRKFADFVFLVFLTHMILGD